MTATASQASIVLTPPQRIAAINLSLRTWVLGMVGFLPIIGLTPGILALFYYFHVRSRYRGEWNPAAGYLTAGGVLAALGLVGSLIVGITIAVVYISKGS